MTLAEGRTDFPYHIDVLDHGYVKFIESWGSDQRIIESARMSTDKGFEGWEPTKTYTCGDCGYKLVATQGQVIKTEPDMVIRCPNASCWKPLQLRSETKGDAKLLAYLWKHKHMTPFEMAGLTIEVKAPLFVFREWHRHRTQGYSEMSARYVPLPDENYVPSKQRIIEGATVAGANRQAQGAVPLQEDMLDAWLEHLRYTYDNLQRVYEMGIELGVPKEIARVVVPVGRYSRMRATANLRNWLQFLALRDSAHAPGAQWEIRQFADAVAIQVAAHFPRTYALFNEAVQ